MIWRRVTSGKTISHSINCSSVDTTIAKANCFWSNFTRWLKSSFQKANSIFSSCLKPLHGTSLLLGWRPKSSPWHIGNLRMRPPVCLSSLICHPVPPNAPTFSYTGLSVSRLHPALSHSVLARALLSAQNAFPIPPSGPAFSWLSLPLTLQILVQGPGLWSSEMPSLNSIPMPPISIRVSH